jgi:hypothetical protein
MVNFERSKFHVNDVVSAALLIATALNGVQSNSKAPSKRITDLYIDPMQCCEADRAMYI